MEQVTPEVGGAIAVLTFMIMMLIGLGITALMVFIYCKIFSKAGYHWAMGLLMLVPIANIIMPFVLAFGDWPVLKKLRMLQSPPSQQSQPSRRNWVGQ